ncbi:MAG TPA: helix-turn-helix domain-containing protein, partial [Candidatus Limiplasma sp.]|nr:helix-turn-helix domain-containing protein [Candidatus Limiplasma sp.]
QQRAKGGEGTDQRAQELLADPMFRVNEIAYAVGYADVAHFSRIFKKVTAKTPMEYRQSLR